MNASPLKASEIEAMTFIFTASVPATPGSRGPWSRLLRWARAKLGTQRRRESATAMSAIDWSFPGL